MTDKAIPKRPSPADRVRDDAEKKDDPKVRQRVLNMWGDKRPDWLVDRGYDLVKVMLGSDERYVELRSPTARDRTAILGGLGESGIEVASGLLLKCIRTWNVTAAYSLDVNGSTIAEGDALPNPAARDVSSEDAEVILEDGISMNDFKRMAEAIMFLMFYEDIQRATDAEGEPVSPKA